MGPNSGPASVTEVTQQEVDEELLNKMTTLKVETLNSGASQKVASFYRSVLSSVRSSVSIQSDFIISRKLQSSGGASLAKLHMTGLKGFIFNDKFYF